jgi:hypothetical protein
MLFMVIEHFKNSDPKSVGDRFRRNGRMLPERLVYLASWIDWMCCIYGFRGVPGFDQNAGRPANRPPQQNHKTFRLFRKP